MLCILPALLIVLTACFPVEEERLPPPVISQVNTQSYATVEVKRGDVLLHRYCFSKLVPMTEIELSFSINDVFLTSINVQEGDRVMEGDIIATLDRGYAPEEANEIEWQETWVKLFLSQLDERYSFDLSRTGVAGFQADATLYNAERDKLLTQLDILRVRMEYIIYEDNRRVIRSPIDGIITDALSFSDGMRSVANLRIASVAGLSGYVFALRGIDSELVSIGDYVEMDVAGDLHMGRVADPLEAGIHRIVDTDEKYIVLLDDSVEITSDYAYANVIFDMSEDTLHVPKAAIRRANERVFVYVLTDGVRSIRDVEIGLEGSLDTEVLTGLNEGELVIMG